MEGRKVDFEEIVYYLLLGEMMDAFKLPWVENAFSSGSPCEQNYAAVLAAYGRLLDRLGMEQEDEDVEIMINSLLRIRKSWD